MKIELNPLKSLSAVAVILATSVYCQAQPSSLTNELTGQPIDSATTKAIVLIHGWNPDDNPDAYVASREWSSLVTALKSKLTGTDWKLVTYHWEQGTIGANTGFILPMNDNPIYEHAKEAAIRAEQQGASLASLLNSQAPGLREAHFIAHSAGSWAAREAMRLLLNANASVVCQMTLLDPFIPDASILVGTATGLSTSKMSATTGLPGNSRIQRLEDYYAEDIIDQCNTPTISTPGAEFTWRAGDTNLQVDWGDSGFPGLSLWYDCHSGPIQFYADTVRFVDSDPAYGGLRSPDFDLNNIGWKKSLFYQEQQLRATITSVSPATLPTSSSPQLITINGTNFKPAGDPNASFLIFYDPANNGYQREPSNVTTTSMQYNLNVQSAAGTWKVKVVNGGVESSPFTFTVTSHGVQLIGLSISGPATVAENGTAQFAATAYFSDGTSSVVTGSSSWHEDSTSTTISSFGLLSAGSVSANKVVTVSADYTFGGATKTGSATITVINAGGGGGSQTTEVIVNGTFESGDNPWGTPDGNADVVNLSYPNSGDWYGYVGNANNASGALSQFFPIPANATAATLEFYIDIVTSETSTTQKYDKLKVDLTTAGDQYVGTIAEFSNLDKGDNTDGTYVLKNYNIMSLLNTYKGQSLFLIFSGTTDGSNPTIFRIDDVSLKITTPTPITLTGLSISGPSSLLEGNGDTYYAKAIFSDGTTQTVSPNEWHEDSSATTISSFGFLLAGQVVSETPVTVTASYTFNGVTKEATKTVAILDSIAPVTFSSLAISGPTALNENSSGQFTATAIFSDGTSQSVTPSWYDDSSATTISGSGVLTAGSVNADTTVSVSATYTTGGVTRNASQDVLIINIPTPPTLTSLTISGPSSVNENTSAQYYGIAGFSDGTVQSVAPTWNEDSTITSISVSGLLVAGEAASDTTVTVSASYTIGGIPQTAQITVMVLNTTGMPTYTLAVNATSGTVSKNPDQTNYVSGSQVTLTAIAPSGFHFSSWSGDATGGDNPLTVTMSANKNITANFAQDVVLYTIAMSASPSAGGTVSGGGTYASGSSRTVTATANSGYTFVNWTESGTPVSTSASYPFTLTGNRTLVANFVLDPRQLTGACLSNGMFHFILNGPAGSNFVIQASSNLVDWLPVVTALMPASGTIPFSIPHTNPPFRQFYRAVPTLGDLGLAAYYPLDGDGTDASGNGKDAFLSGPTPTTNRFGESGRALAFNGTSYVGLMNNRPITGVQNAFSISLWFKANPRFGIMHYHRADYRDIILGWNSGGDMRVGWSVADNTGTAHDVWSQPLATNQWIHCAATYDGTTQYLYVDGQRVATNTWTATVDWNDRLMGEGIGGFDRSDYSFKGCIDEVRFYTRALTSSEVSAAASIK